MNILCFLPLSYCLLLNHHTIYNSNYITITVNILYTYIEKKKREIKQTQSVYNSNYKK